MRAAAPDGPRGRRQAGLALAGVEWLPEGVGLVGSIFLGVRLAPMIVGLVEMVETDDDSSTWFNVGAPAAILGAIPLSAGLRRFLSSKSRLDDPPPRGRVAN